MVSEAGDKEGSLSSNETVLPIGPCQRLAQDMEGDYKRQDREAACS